MNEEWDLERRELLRLLLTLPLGAAVACRIESPESAGRSALVSPEESLSKLIQAVGPWSAEQSMEAERFTKRFLAAQHLASPYLAGSSELIQSLASRFPADAIGLGEVDLGTLPFEERELLLAVVKQLYSLVEIRFLVAGEPQWGVCPEDRLRHTRPPEPVQPLDLRQTSS